MEWEKTVKNDAPNKGLISKIYKQLIQLNNNNNNKKPNEKWAEDLNRHSSKEDIQMAKKTHEKVFNITHYYRNANQNYYRYHFTPARMAIIKKSTNNKCWRGCGEKGALPHFW